jgi:predicted dehydrogenase
MDIPNRRAFLSTAAAAVATQARPILGANDRVNLAVVGLGGRGTDHMNQWVKQPNSRVAALCDVNQEAQERGQARVEKAQGQKPRIYGDMRQLFADKDVDVVSFATPNHWHALGAIWACQAGKDVYAEKPACHNIWEGWKMVEAARKYKRIVQVGSQGRSLKHKIHAMQLLKEGVVGKIFLAKGMCYKRRRSIGHTPDQPAPPGVNWDMFLGPAPMRPFSVNRFKYNWHWFWDTGNGDIGNQGVHEMDMCRWGMNDCGFPKSVTSSGGKFAYQDDQETPNTQLATFDYGDFQIVFEVRGLITGDEGGLPRRGEHTIGNIYYGSDGYMVVDVGGFQVYKGDKIQKVMDEKPAEPEWTPAPHMANLLQAVRSRNPKDLNADVEAGVVSASLCHLANISYRVGRKLTWDETRKQFAGDAEANRLISRDYRKPYAVPEKV